MILGDITSKDYPPFDTLKGQRVKKKIKYSNKGDYQLALRFESQDEVLTIKEKSIDVYPKGIILLRGSPCVHKTKD